MPSTHAPSHGAGQSRPVNSGKLLVACSRSIAVAPVVAVDEIVPVGNQVAERTALMAERDAAVHAARGLIRAAPAPDTAGRPRASRAGARRPAASAASSRAISRKPVALPIGRDPVSLDELERSPLRPRSGLRRERALVVARHHLDEHARPTGVQSARMRAAMLAAGVLDVPRDRARARARCPPASSSGSSSTSSRLQRRRKSPAASST